MRLLILRLGERTFGVEVSAVREVASVGSITRAWGAPPFVDGLVNLRGEVMAVVSLGALLHLASSENDGPGCLVVLRGERTSVALRMDAVLDAVEVSDEELHPPPENLDEFASRFTTAMCQADEHFLSVLDAGAIVAAGPVTERSET